MLHKLKHKSVSEITYRAVKLVRKKIESLTFDAEAIHEELSRFSYHPSRESFLTFPQRRRFFFYESREKVRQVFLEKYPDEFQKSLDRAEQFYNLNFDFLGAQFNYNEKINWKADPLTGKEYPNCYYQFIDIFSNDENKDIKYVCEVNRHQYLIDLSKAYFLTKEDRYARKVIELFYDWVENNSYKIGVNWTCGLEVSVRAYSWIWSLYFLLDSDLVDERFLRTFFQNIYLHGKYLSENQSFYSSPYNHLVGETSALFVIGYLFPEFNYSRKWAYSAWKTLVSEMEKQFHPDGMSVEQASFYHYFSLGFYLQPLILKIQNGDHISQKVLDHLRYIFEFGKALTRPDGTTPAIGDIDDARSIYFNDPEHWDFRNFLALGALLFKSGELKYVAQKDWEDILWLFGVKGWEEFQKIQSVIPQQVTQHFRHSGYFVARSGWSFEDHFFWVDCGDISDGVFKDEVNSAAHGHADILNFEISAYGKNFIIDPGFHNYEGKLIWHKYFRETKAHNCLMIDQLGQATHGEGLMEWSRVAEPNNISIITQEDYSFFRGSHDAYRNLIGTPQHFRNILLLNQELWLIIDEVKGDGEHLIESFLHLAPCGVTMHPNHWCFSLDDVYLNAIFFGDKMEMEIKQGGEQVEEGWISPLYRTALPAPVVKFSWKGHLPFLHFMCFVPHRDKSLKISFQEENMNSLNTEKIKYIMYYQKGASGKPVQGNCLFRIQWEKDNETFSLRFKKDGEDYWLIHNQIKSDGKFVIIREDKID